MSNVSSGWHGTGHEAHLFLSPEDDAMVRAAHARAVEAGGPLDEKLKGLEAVGASYGGELQGLEYSVKGLDSLRRKVASEVAEGADAANVIADTRDLNRYTICFPAESYSRGVAASFDHLQQQGLEPYDPEKTHKNTWNSPSYKGINTSWTDQGTGQFVEIQFHTPESFAVKSENHALYELSRSGSLDSDQQAAADWLQAQRYEGVEIPEEHDSTVPAKPPRELATFSPEALEQVRAKEAELKQSQASEGAAVEPESHPPRTADANDVTQAGAAQGAQNAVGEGPDIAAPEDVEEDVAESPQPSTATEDQGPGESSDLDADGQDAHEADNPPAADASYDDHEDEQDAFPQPVDDGVANPGEADTAVQDAKETDSSPDADDAQEQAAGTSYDDHEDHQMARIAEAAADERQESGDRDDYGDTSFAAENRERGGVGD